MINDVVHTMELDTGASVTLMSETECHKLFPEATLRESSVLLRTYSGDRLPVVGEMDVRVQYGQQIRRGGGSQSEGRGGARVGVRVGGNSEDLRQN